MPLNKSHGNMYGFISHTWNAIKGQCCHDCSYCYMKRWGKQSEIHFDEKELKTDLGESKFIFVGSSCDMFAENIPYEWIRQILGHCRKYNNKYLFQTKNPKRFNGIFPKNTIYCTTIESDINYTLSKAPCVEERLSYIDSLSSQGEEIMITIEPILDFNLYDLINMIKHTCPIQVNIGADSGHNNLPEPSKEKVLELIIELKKITKVYLKKNLTRIIK